MSFYRAFQWYHSHADPIWPDGTFKIIRCPLWCISSSHSLMHPFSSLTDASLFPSLVHFFPDWWIPSSHSLMHHFFFPHWCIPSSHSLMHFLFFFPIWCNSSSHSLMYFFFPGWCIPSSHSLMHFFFPNWCLPSSHNRMHPFSSITDAFLLPTVWCTLFIT